MSHVLLQQSFENEAEEGQAGSGIRWANVSVSLAKENSQGVPDSQDLSGRSGSPAPGSPSGPECRAPTLTPTRGTGSHHCQARIGICVCSVNTDMESDLLSLGESCLMGSKGLARATTATPKGNGAKGELSCYESSSAM